MTDLTRLTKLFLLLTIVMSFLGCRSRNHDDITKIFEDNNEDVRIIYGMKNKIAFYELTNFDDTFTKRIEIFFDNGSRTTICLPPSERTDREYVIIPEKHISGFDIQSLYGRYALLCDQE